MKKKFVLLFIFICFFMANVATAEKIYYKSPNYNLKKFSSSCYSFNYNYNTSWYNYFNSSYYKNNNQLNKNILFYHLKKQIFIIKIVL